MAGTTAEHELDGDEPDDLLDGSGDGHLSALPVSSTARGLLLVVGGVLGFYAAFALTLDKFKLAADPTFVPGCDVNAFISCGQVMGTPEAAVFGFPNSLIGVAAFAVSTLLGVLVLARTPLPRFVERGYLLGITAGAVFVGWLISQALYDIHVLCPWCMVVWAVVVPTFWTHLADALDRGLLPVPAALRPVARTVVDYRVLLIVLTYGAVVAMVVQAFWTAWLSLL